MKKFMKDSIVIFVSNVFRQAVSVATGIVIPRVLGPAFTGMLNTIKLIPDWASFAELGGSNGLSKEVPYLRGKKDLGRIDHIKDSVFVFMVVSSLAASVLVLISVFVWNYFKPLPSEIVYGAVLFLPSILLINIFNFYWAMLRSNNEFTVIAHMQYIWAAVFGIVLLSLIKYLFIYAFVIATNAAFLFADIYAFHKAGFSLRFRFFPEEMSKMFRIGLPLTLAAFIPILWYSADRLIIAKYLGWRELGFYVLGLEIILFTLTIPGNLVHTIAPKIYEEAGLVRHDVRKYIVKPTYVLTFITLTAAGCLYVLMPALIDHIFPKFSGALLTSRVIIVTRSFLVLSLIPAFVFAAFNRSYYLVIFQLVTAIAIVVFDLLSVYLGLGILGVAWGSGVILIVYSVFISIFAYYYTNKDFKNAVSYISFLFFIFAYFWLAAYFMDIIPVIKEFGTGTLAGTSIKLALYITILIPFIIVVGGRTGVISELVGLWKHRT